jgi:ABC-type glycerol-3-phosphate transport system permease component
MLGLVLRIVLFGLLGSVVTPIVVGFAGLALIYSVDSRCGTPGDSGGCEMGIASLAIASALPGLAIGVAFALFLHFRKKRVTPVVKP